MSFAVQSIFEMQNEESLEKNAHKKWTLFSYSIGVPMSNTIVYERFAVFELKSNKNVL